MPIIATLFSVKSVAVANVLWEKEKCGHHYCSSGQEVENPVDNFLDYQIPTNHCEISTARHPQHLSVGAVISALFMPHWAAHLCHWPAVYLTVLVF